ncbi:MAG: thioredoxin family protein [Verrucomicrobiae bacterium]|nr:thioredoxin family protein [Verrucomicrobiae bacterium]
MAPFSRPCLSLAVLTCLTAFDLGTTAVFAAPSRDGAVTAELISEVDSIQPGKPFTVALKLEIDSGWHTYWKNPGDSGFPTKIAWNLPEGFSPGAIEFPYPHQFSVDFGGIKQIGLGYTHDHPAVHLIEITPPANLAAGTEVTLSGKVNWLMCDDHQCVPGGVDLSLSLPVSEKSSVVEATSEWFADARRNIPAKAPDWQLSVVEKDEKTLSFTVTVPGGASSPQMDGLSFYPDQSGVVNLSAPQQFSSAGNALTIDFPKAAYFSKLPEPLGAVLISEAGFADFDGRSAIEVSTAGATATASKGTAAPVAAPDSAPPDSADESESDNPEKNSDNQPEETRADAASSPFGGSLLAILLAGFLGGMILNVMPCVFPVISLKILSFVSHAGDERRKVLTHGAIYTIGILLFFLALAGIVIALGLAWGGQFQSPLFVMVMTAVIVVLSLSLFGVCELGVKLTGVGGELTQSSGYAGSFWSGALAVILATPCTGPFLGSSLGWALEQPPLVVISFFTMMGLGMAAPYVLLTLFPALTRRLPRPGPWMETFKQIMGFPMLAAAVFLLWILNGQIGDTGLALFMGALVLLGLAAWAWGRFGHAASKSKVAGYATIAIGVVGAIVLSNTALNQSGQAAEESETADSRPIAEIIEGYRAEGKNVFVDFTARWCAICQTNKPAMYSEETKAAFEKYNVVFVEADWTNKNDDIYQFLKEHGRRSVPYYPIFPADPSRGPVELPQNLTPGIILDHLKKLDDVEANFPVASLP